MLEANLGNEGVIARIERQYRKVARETTLSVDYAKVTDCQSARAYKVSSNEIVVIFLKDED